MEDTQLEKLKEYMRLLENSIVRTRGDKNELQEEIESEVKDFIRERIAALYGGKAREVHGGCECPLREYVDELKMLAHSLKMKQKNEKAKEQIPQGLIKREPVATQQQPQESRSKTIMEELADRGIDINNQQAVAKALRDIEKERTGK